MFSYLWQTFGYNEKSKNDDNNNNDKKIIKKTTSDIIVKQPTSNSINSVNSVNSINSGNGVAGLKKISNPINFYYLSLIKEDTSWSIHGLWPQYTKSKYPKFCHRATFDIKTLNPIIDRLNSEWYSNIGPDDEFWRHEYLKHGTCNFNSFNEYQYFKTTLDLFDKANAINIPKLFYNIDTDKCLIPVDQNMEFFIVDN